VRAFLRADFGTAVTEDAFFFVNVAGLVEDFNGESPGLAFQSLHFGIRDNVDVGVASAFKSWAEAWRGIWLKVTKAAGIGWEGVIQ
jgi:hypothetical protein